MRKNIPRKRKPPRLPPPWIRRADWRFRGTDVVFFFPGLDPAAEGRELHRLCDWSEQNTSLMASWMAKVDRHRGPPVQCLCPQCVAEMEGRA